MPGAREEIRHRKEQENANPEYAGADGDFGQAAGILHVIRRVDADTLLYEITVDDATTWTKPWTAQVPMVKAEGLIYEYACHEGNYGMFGILSGARAIEKKVANGGSPR